jgi:hypothetical protein
VNELFKEFDFDQDNQIRQQVFGILWQHLLAEAHDPKSQREHLQDRKIVAIKLLMKKGSHGATVVKKRKRSYHLQALKDNIEATAIVAMLADKQQWAEDKLGDLENEKQWIKNLIAETKSRDTGGDAEVEDGPGVGSEIAQKLGEAMKEGAETLKEAGEVAAEAAAEEAAAIQEHIKSLKEQGKGAARMLEAGAEDIANAVGEGAEAAAEGLKGALDGASGALEGAKGALEGAKGALDGVTGFAGDAPAVPDVSGSLGSVPDVPEVGTGLEVAKGGVNVSGGDVVGDVGVEAPAMAAKLGGSLTKQSGIQLDKVPDIAKHVRIPNMGPTFKIFFGWGQILASFNLTFSVPWPASFNELMKGMYAPFNLDITKYFGEIGCSVQTDYVGAFTIYMLTPLFLFFVLFCAVSAAIMYRKVAKNKPLYDNSTLTSKSMRLVNMIVFVLYPGLGLRVFRVFDTRTYGDHSYLVADLSIRTDDPRYITMVGLAWTYMVLYVVGFPSVMVCILLYFRKLIAHDPDDEDQAIPHEFHKDVMAVRTSFGSIYRDYRRRAFLWEIVEMVRKVVLVGALVLMSKGGMQIFFGVLICFLYVFAAAYVEPFIDHADQFLQYATSVQLFTTLLTGLMLSFKSYEAVVMPELQDPDKKDDVFLELMLMISSGSVFFCIGAVFVITLKDMFLAQVASCTAYKAQKKKEALEKEKIRQSQRQFPQEAIKAAQGPPENKGAPAQKKYVVQVEPAAAQSDGASETQGEKGNDDADFV